MRSVGLVARQGVRLEIRSEHGDLADYVRMHLPGHVTPEPGEPHMQVNVEWHEGPGLEPEVRTILERTGAAARG